MLKLLQVSFAFENFPLTYEALMSHTSGSYIFFQHVMHLSSGSGRGGNLLACLTP